MPKNSNVICQKTRPGGRKWIAFLDSATKSTLKTVNRLVALEYTLHSVIIILCVSEIILNINFVMSIVSARIQELFKSGQTPSKICKLLKGRVSRAGVYKALKRLKMTGSTFPTARSTSKRKVKTPKLIKNTRKKLRRNPHTSIRKLASEAGVSYGTMPHVNKKDLKLSPYKKTKAQLLTQAAKTKRLQRAKLLLKKLGDDMQPPVLWTDEKLQYSQSRLCTIIRMTGFGQ